MTFIARKIDVSFNLAIGEFGDKKGSEVVYSGLRCEVSINSVGADSLNSLQMRIYGMSESTMNSLSMLGVNLMTTRKNVVTVSASNEIGGMTQVFQGTITNAWSDYRGAPEVSFNLTAIAGFYENVKAIAVNSFKGPTDAATVIESLAKSMGFSFSNNGVNVKLASPYFAGSAIAQIKSCARQAQISYDISNGAVRIWPGDSTVDTASFIVSPDTGLVGYPTFSSIGLLIQTIYNPDLTRGRKVDVRSSIPGATKPNWVVQTVRHELASETPNGAWFTNTMLAEEGVNVIPR